MPTHGGFYFNRARSYVEQGDDAKAAATRVRLMSRYGIEFPIIHTRIK